MITESRSRTELINDEFNGPLEEFALEGPENERNPIEHPELAYRRGLSAGRAPYRCGARESRCAVVRATACPRGLSASHRELAIPERQPQKIAPPYRKRSSAGIEP